MSVVDFYSKDLSSEDQQLHRQAFLHFLNGLASNSSEVTAKCVDGKNIKAIFHTMTPFPGRDFQVCMKGAQAVVRCHCHNRPCRFP